jgi:hypothetical protein
MSEPRTLTELEAAVVRMLDRPSRITCDDLQADFLLRAFSNPVELVQAAFISVDCGAIREHLERSA